MFKTLIIIILIIALGQIAFLQNARLDSKLNESRFAQFKLFCTDTLSQHLERLDLLESTTLRKPSYNAQGSLLFLSDGSAYMPVLFKDEATLDKWKGEVQWQDNLKGKEWEGYYDFKKIYVPRDN